jgi:hypothetical protein
MEENKKQIGQPSYGAIPRVPFNMGELPSLWMNLGQTSRAWGRTPRAWASCLLGHKKQH